MEKLLARPDEAAATLGVGRTRIYQLLATGALPSVRVGRSVRVPMDALRDWIATNMSRRESGPEGGSEK